MIHQFQDNNTLPVSEQPAQELANGDHDISQLKITEQKSEMENVPINNENSIATPTMEEVIHFYPYLSHFIMSEFVNKFLID